MKLIEWYFRAVVIESHPSRGGWIEIFCSHLHTIPPPSHPSRGGWIEMDKIEKKNGLSYVPPLTGWVD